MENTSQSELAFVEGGGSMSMGMVHSSKVKAI
jgi:hypothetical protein